MKNRSLRVSLERDPADGLPVKQREIDQEKVLYWNAVVRSNVEALGKGLIVLYAAKKAIDTTSVLIIKAAG